MRDSQEGGEPNPTVDDCSHFKKNCSVLSCIGKRQNAVTETRKMRQFTADKMERASSAVIETK